MGLQSHSGPHSKRSGPRVSGSAPAGQTLPREHSLGCMRCLDLVGSRYLDPGKETCAWWGKDPAVGKAQSVPQGLRASQSHPHAPFCEPRTRTRDSARP